MPAESPIRTSSWRRKSKKSCSGGQQAAHSPVTPRSLCSVNNDTCCVCSLSHPLTTTTHMKTLLSTFVLLVLPIPALAEGFKIIATGGKADQSNVVCMVALPEGEAANVEALKILDGRPMIWAQTIGPGVLQKQDKTRYVIFVLPTLKAGETVSLIPTPAPDESKSEKQFSFVDEKGKHTDLLFGNRPMLRYINAPHDPSNHFLTFKPFHHVFDPAEGKTL